MSNRNHKLEKISQSFTMAHYTQGQIHPLFHSAKKRKKEP